MSTFDPYLISFFSGILVGFIVNAGVAVCQRPSLEITSDDDRPDRNCDTRFLHVRVKNKKHRVFNRNMAVDCESQVWIADAKTGLIKDGSPFKTKWARLSNLAYVDSTRRLEWIPVPALETRISIYPGHSDGGKEGLQLDIVKKTKKECIVHDPEIYVERHRSGDLSKWQLEQGKYYVMIRIQYAQKQSDAAYFLLTNEELYETTLTECPKDQLKIAKRIFQD